MSRLRIRGRNANAPTSRSIARRMRLFRSPVETTEPLVLAPCLAVAALERFFAIDFSSSLGRSFSEAMPLDVTQVELKHYRDCKKLSNSLVRRAPLHDDLLAFWHKETLFRYDPDCFRYIPECVLRARLACAH